MSPSQTSLRSTVLRVLLGIFISLTAACAHQGHQDNPLWSGSHRKPASAQTCFDVFAVWSNRDVVELDQARAEKIEDLHRKGRWQEAAWLLRQLNDHTRADQLEAEIERALWSENYSIEPMNTSTPTVSEVYLVTFENGLKAVFKPHADFWKTKSRVHVTIASPDAEVLSYQFAIALHLAIVPVTIKRTLGGMMGSLQIFIERANLTYSWTEMQNPAVKGPVHELIWGPIDRQKYLIALFDYLIWNTDRHARNYLDWTMDSRLSPLFTATFGAGKAAIDGGAAFSNEGKYRPLSPHALGIKDAREFSGFFEALKTDLTPKRIREILTGAFSEYVITATIQRREVLLKFFAEASAEAEARDQESPKTKKPSRHPRSTRQKRLAK